jgi:hypothetical protein
MTYVNSAYAYLIALSATYKQHYFPGIADVLQRFGKTTRLMPRPPVRLDGPSMEVEVTSGHNRSTRVTRDLMLPMPDPGPGTKTRYTVNFDHTDPSANDFAALEITFRTTFFDLKKRADSNYKHMSKDPIREDFDEGMADVKEMFAKYLHLPSDGLLGTLAASGTVVFANDTDIIANAAAYANETTAFLQLAPMSIGRIGIRQLIDFYDASTDQLLISNVTVTWVHPFDTAIMVTLNGADSVNAAGNQVNDFTTWANSDKIYHSMQPTDPLNQGSRPRESPVGTLDEFFDISTAYYGRDRTDPLYQILQPLRLDVGTDVDLTADHIRRVGETVAWQQGDSTSVSPRALVMARDQYRAMAAFATDEGIKIVPGTSADVGNQIKRVVGDDGYVIHDPNMGQIALVVDDFAAYGQIDFLDMGTWRMVIPWADAEFQMIPGPIAGMWTRNTEDDGTGRPSKVFSANGIWSFCFINLGAIRNARLQGLNAAL